jgi:hypothetical protein
MGGMALDEIAEPAPSSITACAQRWRLAQIASGEAAAIVAIAAIIDRGGYHHGAGLGATGNPGEIPDRLFGQPSRAAARPLHHAGEGLPVRRLMPADSERFQLRRPKCAPVAHLAVAFS